MTPTEIDQKILDKLAGNPCILSELAERVGISAKEILKRLHVLGGMKLVSCERQDGSLVWGLSGEVTPKERGEHIKKPEPKRAPAPSTAGRPPGATETALEVMERTECARAQRQIRGAPPPARGHLPDPDPRVAIIGRSRGEGPADGFYRRETERLSREEECPNPWQVVVVRERTTIPEIRVTKLPREVVIAVIHEDPAKSEGVCIPRDPVVLGALIDAIKQVMA